MYSGVLYTIVVGFFVGVAFYVFIPFSLITYVVWCCICVSCFLLILYIRSKQPFVVYAHYVRVCFFVSLFLVSLGVGGMRFVYVASTFETNDFLKSRIGRDVEFFAVVVAEPDQRETSTRLMLHPVDIETGKYIADEKVLVTLPALHTPLFYGDTVSVVGTLEVPQNFETDTGREFDYVSYVKKDGVRYEMFRPQIHIESHGQGNILVLTMLRIKDAFLKSISRSIPQPEASLAGGILLGAKHSLSKKTQQDFRKSGLIHVVVLSGYNVTIVADCIVRLFSFLPKMYAGSMGVLGIIFFALITGGGATVVRASIMSLLVLVARFTGRPYDVLRALAVASCAMVFHNPHILLSDPSFQLSCMATFALIVYTSPIERTLWWLPATFQIRSCVASTLATQFFLLPMLIYMTGMVSLVALVNNILVLAVIPLAMCVSFIAGVCGFVSAFAGSIAGYVAYTLLGYVFTVVELSVRIPFAYVELGVIPVWIVLCIYAIFISRFVYVQNVLPPHPN